MHLLRSKLSSNSLKDRLWTTVLLFIALFYGGMILSYFLLPEGLLKDKNPLQNWEPSSNIVILTMQIFFYNMLSVLTIAFASLFGKKKDKEQNYLSVGYAVFFTQMAINSIVYGTWSFSLGGEAIPLLNRITRTVDLAHRAGLWEMTGQLLITCSLAHISTVLTSAKDTVTRKIRDIRLNKAEIAGILTGFALMLTGAVVESIAIHSL